MAAVVRVRRVMTVMSKQARLFVLLASLLFVPVYFVPLWSVSLLAPQYPEGLGMRIHINTVAGAKANDLRSINGLNHYIGMKAIDPEAIPELRFMPWIVAGLLVTGLVVAALGRRRLLGAWLGAQAVLLGAGLVDFWRWEYDYGHDLDMAHAIIKIPGMSYQPPLIGSKQLLNFTATSWPGLGAWALGSAFALGIAAFWVSRRTRPRTAPGTTSARPRVTPVAPRLASGI
jgi:copper chaperone NosL